MKRLAALVVLIACCPTLVLAQAGAICIYADAAATNCNPVDNVPGLFQLYVIHDQTPGATAAQFAAPMPACMVGATWLSDTPAFPVAIGDSQNGISIAYGACLAGPVNILAINYFGQGTTLPDCAYSVVNDPAETLIKVVDCAATELFATGGTTYLNSSLACECESAPIPPVLEVSPTGLSFAPLDNTKFFQISNVGGSTLDWTVTDDQPWLAVSPLSGSGDATLTVGVDRTGLPDDTYLGQIDVQSNGGNASLLVSMIVDTPPPPEPEDSTLIVTPDSLCFHLGIDQLSFNIIYAEPVGCPLWEATPNMPWISVSPTSGLAGSCGDNTVTVTVDRTGLTGSLVGKVTLTTSIQITRTVTIKLNAGAPIIDVDPMFLNYGYGLDVLFFQITNTGEGVLDWAVASGDSWMGLSPTSGSGDAIVTATVDRTGLPLDDYFGSIFVASNGGNRTVNTFMTTQETVRAEQTTWGRVKAIYGDLK